MANLAGIVDMEQAQAVGERNEEAQLGADELSGGNEDAGDEDTSRRELRASRGRLHHCSRVRTLSRRHHRLILRTSALMLLGPQSAPGHALPELREFRGPQTWQAPGA